MRRPSPARKALGLAALLVFVGMQPSLACGIHCAFFAHHDSTTGHMDMGTDSPFPACHHQLSVVAGHTGVLPDVASAPPAAQVTVSMPRTTARLAVHSPLESPPGTVFDPESPPPRA